MNNYKNFQLYKPSDAKPATLYWSSQDNVDWRVAKELTLQSPELTTIIYNLENGKITAVNPNISDIVPTGKSLVILDLIEVALDGSLQSSYIIKEGELIKVDNQTILAQRWEDIKSLRSQKVDGGVLVQSVGKWFHSDMPSKMQMQTFILLLLMGEYQSTAWKTMDGTFVQMDEVTLKQVFKALVSNELAAFQVAEIHRNLMSTSSDPYNYNILTMWSPTFKESQG